MTGPRFALFYMRVDDQWVDVPNSLHYLNAGHTVENNIVHASYHGTARGWDGLRICTRSADNPYYLTDVQPLLTQEEIIHLFTQPKAKKARVDRSYHKSFAVFYRLTTADDGHVSFETGEGEKAILMLDARETVTTRTVLCSQYAKREGWDGWRLAKGTVGDPFFINAAVVRVLSDDEEMTLLLVAGRSKGKHGR